MPAVILAIGTAGAALVVSIAGGLGWNLISLAVRHRRRIHVTAHRAEDASGGLNLIDVQVRNGLDEAVTVTDVFLVPVSKEIPGWFTTKENRFQAPIERWTAPPPASIRWSIEWGQRFGTTKPIPKRWAVVVHTSAGPAVSKIQDG